MTGIGLSTAIPQLPRPAWVVLAADALSAVGSGLTLPFLLIYLTRAHGFSLELAGAALAAVAVASLIGNPLGGSLADRIGPRLTLCLGLAIAGNGVAVLAMMSVPWQGFAGTALAGLGVAIAWPAQDAMLARLVREDQRASVYGIHHATLNLGLGAGALLAAVILDPDRPSSFVTLYWVDAATFLLAIPVIMSVGVPPAAPPRAARGGTGYRTVLADKVFVRVWIVIAILTTVGYGQFNSAFPAYATGPGGLDPRLLSAAFAANTVTVVLAQLVSLKLLAGRRRTRALMLLCGVWATTWAIVPVAGTLGGIAAVMLFALAAVVFGFGETLLAPTVPALVNDLAPDHLRGRYNGGSTLGYTTGFVAGPLLAGLLLGQGLGGLLFVILIAACGGCALLVRRLEHHVPESLNRVGAHQPAPVMEKEPV